MKRALKRILPAPVFDVVLYMRKLLRKRLTDGPLTYNQDGLATIHNADFILDPRFRRAYSAGLSTGSWIRSDVQWRAYVACWAAKVGAGLEGDFVECGVNRGGLARTIIEFIDFSKTGKKFYLLDTYEGLVDRYITDEERKLGISAGRYAPCFEIAQKNFLPFRECTVLVKGAVPETLSQVPKGPIAYLSIDMNSAIPEIAAAEYFWPQMSSHAVMLLDDYGWPGHIEQKKAFDRFATERDLIVLPLPTGQGMLIKP